jgi:DNA-binding Lrp family transcriptional regulator
MITEKETVLLQHLRKNSRKSLAQISQETNIPISTLFDMLKRLESNVIEKHVSLLDFAKLGYSLKASFIISTQQKQELKEFLLQHPNVNNLSSLINGYDFFVECVFKDFKEMVQFKEKISDFEVDDIQESFIIEELKKECFGVTRETP